MLKWCLWGEQRGSFANSHVQSVEIIAVGALSSCTPAHRLPCIKIRGNHRKRREGRKEQLANMATQQQL